MELLECMRYYQCFGKKSVSGYYGVTLSCSSNNAFAPFFNYHVPMRIIPSIKINGLNPGETIYIRNVNDNSTVEGIYELWNNSYTEKLNRIHIYITAGTPIIGGFYEALIEASADL